MNLVKEKKLLARGYRFIAGVDEVGRGAWAGPIVAAAVVVDKKFFNQPPSWLKQIKDSKLLSPQQRTAIFEQAKQEVIWSVALVSNRQIDRYGLTWANHKVITTAVACLKQSADYVLSDYVAGLPQQLNGIMVESVVAGDAKVAVIALASIMAKVYRDKLMIKYALRYPVYGFTDNKGYGTAEHRQALDKQGACPWHRLSYRPVKSILL